MPRLLWVLLAALLIAGAAEATTYTNSSTGQQSPGTVIECGTPGTPCGLGKTFFNVNSSFTRATNNSQYTANTAVCGSTSVVCTPLSWSVARNNNSTMTLQQLKMTKSGSATTSATFIVWLYSATPTVSTTIKDNVGYTGPFAADWANYIGSATCSTTILGTDSNVFYDCTLSQTVLIGQSGAAVTTIFGLIEVTGTWTPTSGETIQVELSGYQD